jgi:outer membrane immunogenic protein
MNRLIVARLVAVIGLSFGASAVAMAADFGASYPAPAPYYPKAVMMDWTGFYIGGNVGGVFQSASGTSDFQDTADGSTNPQSNSPSNTSFTGGAQFGYNWQFAPHWLVGVEGDWDWMQSKYSFCRQTDINSSACFDNGFGFETVSSQANWMATARTRAGFVWDRVMFYGTGGLAWASVQTTESLSCSVAGCGAGSNVPFAGSSTFNDIKTGWTAGFGVEGMLTQNWTVRAEWLHTDLGTISDTASTTTPFGTQSVVWSRDERFDTFRVGVNYLFH